MLRPQAIAKYAGVVVLDRFAAGGIYPLLTLRQNIYTDPQKPIQVEPKLYEIGTPGPDSPLLITTNFSLTYFSVSGEVEGSGVPAGYWSPTADGQSVLTAWAAGKFDAEKIAKTVKGSGIEEQAQPQEDRASRPRRRPFRRDRRRAARLADHGRPARRGRHPQLPEERLERVTRTRSHSRTRETQCERPAPEPQPAEMRTVAFTPVGETVEVALGASLLDAAIAAGVDVPAPCGGQGRCGRCRVRVKSGDAQRRASARLEAADIADGYALACQTFIAGPLTVHVPPREREQVRPQAHGARGPTSSRSPATGGRDPRCALSAARSNRPILADNTSDLDRLRRELSRQHGIDEIRAELTILRTSAAPCAKPTGTSP